MILLIQYCSAIEWRELKVETRSWSLDCHVGRDVKRQPPHLPKHTNTRATTSIEDHPEEFSLCPQFHNRDELCFGILQP
jgi:hypothetical protein